jgi:hypothetical protein
LPSGGKHLRYAAFGLDFHQSAAAGRVAELRRSAWGDVGSHFASVPPGISEPARRAKDSLPRSAKGTAVVVIPSPVQILPRKAGVLRPD